MKESKNVNILKELAAGKKDQSILVSGAIVHLLHKGTIAYTLGTIYDDLSTLEWAFYEGQLEVDSDIDWDLDFEEFADEYID